MRLLEIAVGLIAALLLLPISVLAVEVLAAFVPHRAGSPEGVNRPRVAILVPAHDEASTIGATLRLLLTQLLNTDRIVVVADNCSDDTTAVAAAGGAEVIIRNDRSRRGKGYALDFGVRHLEQDPPQVVMIIDADCRVTDGTIDRLARVCGSSGRPVQAMYLIQAPAEAGIKVRIAEFACALKNRMRALGLHRLRLPSQLLGTGMAFPWTCISKVPLATGHLVEDLKLGLDLTASGAPPLFCPEALVTSDFPASEEGLQSQRTRWEHGYLGVLMSEGPSVLLRSLRTLNGPLFALALDLCVPPLTLLTLAIAAVWAISAALYATAHSRGPMLIASTDALLLFGSVLLCWVRYGRRILSLGDLAQAVSYVLWKLPLYGRFLLSRQIDWVRSKRD
jgi:cellulose synthase/poly-beta-1,6-N-acetylglucosamine synthase-like glycosyltransferase